MRHRSPLDDPQSAAFAWARWKRIMAIVAAVALAVVAAALGGLWVAMPDATIHVYIAVALGVGLSILLAGALMGLMFLSNGTGHDAAAADPFEDGWR